MKKIITTILIILFSNFSYAQDSLTLGFVPSRSVHNIQVSATKIADYLSEKIGIPVKSITLSNYAAVVVGIKAKRVDIAFVGPLNYLILHEKTGAYPITAAVRRGKLGYKSLIITNKNSGINNLSDLKNKRFAFGDSLSASSNLYPKSLLKDAGIDPKKDLRSILVSSQSAIVLSVMQGKVDAGAVYNDARVNPEVLSKFPDILNKTKILAESKLIPADPQVVRKGLSNDVVNKIRDALVSLSKTVEGKKLLKEIYGIDYLTPVSDDNYQGLRDIVKQIKPEILS